MNRWEENQLLTSGVVTRSNLDEEDEDQELRVHLIILDTKPPFLSKGVEFSKMQDPTMPVKVRKSPPWN